MSKPITNCPNCRLRADMGSHLHCSDSPTCTWNKCTSCKTTYDRYTGNFPKVAA